MVDVSFDNSSAAMHPVLHASITHPWQFDPACQLFAHFQLPNGIFIDRHELAERARLGHVGGIVRLLHVDKIRDLEAPAWEFPDDRSDFLTIELDQTFVRDLRFPFHLRYFAPSSIASSECITLNGPVIYYKCADKQLHINARQVTPIDTADDGTNGYSYLINSNTTLELRVPVVGTEVARTVELGTLCIVWVAFAWLLYRVIRARPGKHLKKS